MSIHVNAPGWKRQALTRGAGAVGSVLPGLPADFVADDARIDDEVVLEAPPATRGRGLTSDTLDVSSDIAPDQAAILAIRRPSGALTFHLPVQTTTRGLRGPSEVRFQVSLRRTDPQTRGFAGQVVKAIVVKVAKLAGDRLVSLVLPKLVEEFEKRTWRKKGIKEGWLHVTKETLATGALVPGRPVSPERSLLFVHGTFSNAAAAYGPLAKSTFFDRVRALYDDRIFAFNHFSLSRTPEENARMLLEDLPELTTTFDVITHSRGGLVLRNVVERAQQFGPAARRFKLGRAVLVASPNEGTPLATPERWDQTVGWIANVLEMFPDNPFSTGAAFVADALVWLANHASGDIPGLQAMDGRGEPIAALQKGPGPAADAYSALVANYSPETKDLKRLLDMGLDQFFGSANDLVVPSEGGWHIERGRSLAIPAARIGCFGPGGNLRNDGVTHVSFFSQPETVDFLVAGLDGQRQRLERIDPVAALPNRQVLRGAAQTASPSAAAEEVAAAEVPAARAGRRRLRTDGPTAAAASTAQLCVSITNGDLTFEPAALLLGHYTATELTGTEQIMNGLIGGAMAQALKLGAYPSTVAAHEIFINDRANLERGAAVPRPKAVIVAGLGAEGTLRPADLVSAVRLAVIGWARRLAEPAMRHAKGQGFELASTLIGSGGTGISAGQAARLIAQGVCEANARLDEDARDERGQEVCWPRCKHLKLIELYLDRATDAWRALHLQQEVTPGVFSMEPSVREGKGALPRPPDSGYRGAGYDFITVETKKGRNGDTTLEYVLDTRRARSEVRGQHAQSLLVKKLVAIASNDQNRDRAIGRTLFNLLIPIDLDAFLAGSGEMQMSLDLQTAAIPWELLDVNRAESEKQRPWAIRVKLLRKLRLERFRERVVDADLSGSALLIGEPECPPEYPRLDGARAEVVAVQTSLLSGPRALPEALVTQLISEDPTKPGPDAELVINTLFEKAWRIVHVAGHGVPAANGKPGGVVLSNRTFLGPDEIRSMRIVPELVFLNCCYLAKGDDKALLNPQYDRAEFASGVAGALIDIGVRCVIAAGWAVEDDPASDFASRFYSSILAGERFIDAVGHARQAAYDRNPEGNTWAAYQCYGDPDWRFRMHVTTTNEPSGHVDDYAGVVSARALDFELERVFVESRFQGANPIAQTSKLQTLEKRFASGWGARGSTAELFGRAFAEAGAMESAMNWYQRAVDAPDGSTSMKAAEQLGNARSRYGWELVDQAARHRDAMLRQRDALNARRGSKDAPTAKARTDAARALAGAERRVKARTVEARALIALSLRGLRELAAFKSTMERESLIGSAHKRLALVDTIARNTDRVRADLRAMQVAYEKAVEVGSVETGADLYYPGSNLLAAEIATGFRSRKPTVIDVSLLKRVRGALGAKSGAAADFWSLVGAIEVDEYEAIAKRALGVTRTRDRLDAEYRRLFDRAKSPLMWASVYDNAQLILGAYAAAPTSAPREKAAARALLARLRSFAHPETADA